MSLLHDNSTEELQLLYIAMELVVKVEKDASRCLENANPWKNTCHTSSKVCLVGTLMSIFRRMAEKYLIHWISVDLWHFIYIKVGTFVSCYKKRIKVECCAKAYFENTVVVQKYLQSFNSRYLIVIVAPSTEIKKLHVGLVDDISV